MTTADLECPLFQRLSTGIQTPGLIDRALAIGASAETAATLVDGLGVSLAQQYSASGSNRQHVLEVNADTGSTDLTGDTYVGAIRGRMLVGTTQTNASIIAILGDLSIGSGKDISANFFALRGHLDFWGNTAISGTSFVGALSAYVENEGTTTVGAGQYLMGIDIYQVGAPSVNAAGFNPAIYVRASSAAAIWAKTLLVGANMHCTIDTTDSTKTVRINSRTYTTAASIIGLQTKPRAGVNMTNDIIGIESMPGINSTFTSTAGIACYKAEPYIHATAGAITGDVRCFEGSVGKPSGAGTITGTMSVLKCIHNGNATVTGGVYPIHVITHGDALAWSGFALLPDDGNIASTAVPGTLSAWIKVKIGTTVRYIGCYTTP